MAAASGLDMDMAAAGAGAGPAYWMREGEEGIDIADIDAILAAVTSHEEAELLHRLVNITSMTST